MFKSIFIILMLCQAFFIKTIPVVASKSITKTFCSFENLDDEIFMELWKSCQITDTKAGCLWVSLYIIPKYYRHIFCMWNSE